MEFFKGDSYSFKFQRKQNGEVIKSLPQKMYFTVKDSLYGGNKIFQKTLENGITKSDDDYYHILINPEDTDEMSYKDYFYDIEVITRNYKKTIASGILNFKREITTLEDEV